MDLAVEIKEEVEVSEPFMWRSTNEGNDETVFPSGLILIHDQPILTATAPCSPTGRHLLSCTPIYNDEKGTPSYLQTSAPNSSIIETNNSEIQFLRQAIQPIASGGTRFSARLRRTVNLATEDPLDISPSRILFDSEPTLPVDANFILTPNSSIGSNLESVQGEAPDERKRRQNVESSRRFRERQRQSETLEQRKARLAANAESLRKRLAKQTPERRKARLAANAASLRKRVANQTPEQKIVRLARDAAQHRKRLVVETVEQRTARLTRLVQCEYCQKSLAPRKLRYHIIRQHSKAEDKKFECDHCEKTFALECDRKRHLLTHSQEKRFICDKCGKGYKDRKGLTNHIIFKHRFDEDVQEKYWKE